MMMMKTKTAALPAAALALLVLIAGCASTGQAVSGKTIDEAIAEAAAKIEEKLPAGSEVALVNISSPSAVFSDYVLTNIETALVDSGKLVVVDRANLDKVRDEQGFQASMEVSDESAKAIGQMLGAAAIVTGNFTALGPASRLALKAITVEKATVAAAYQADIVMDARMAALLAASPSQAAAAQTAGAQASAAKKAAAQLAAPDKPFAAGAFGGLWNGVLTYEQGGESYYDTYRVGFYADGTCWVFVAASDGAVQAADGIWADEDGKLRVDCRFSSPAIARLPAVNWLSLYVLQSANRALRINIKPAPDAAGVASLTLYKEQ